jgi:hypothetical protein
VKYGLVTSAGEDRARAAIDAALGAVATDLPQATTSDA